MRLRRPGSTRPARGGPGGLLALIAVATLAGGCATPAAAPSRLVDSRWQMIDASFRLAAPPAPRPTLEIRAGRLSAAGGCNLALGSFREAAGRIEVSGLAATRRACADDVERVEHAYFGLLGDNPDFELQGNVLILRSERARARFIRLPAQGGESISRSNDGVRRPRPSAG